MGVDGEAWIFFGEQEIGALPQYLELGERVSIVDISRPGKNSLDFHLVLYLGYLVGRHEPNARFVIVAADGDYDPVIAHALSKGRKVERVEDLAVMPAVAELPSKSVVATSNAPPKSAASESPARVQSVPKAGKPKSVSLVYGGILNDVRGFSRPRNLEALKTRIQSRIGQEPAPDKVAAVIARLETMDVIKVIEGVLIYAPLSPAARSTKN